MKYINMKERHMTENELNLLSEAIGILNRNNYLCAEALTKLLYEYGKLVGERDVKQ